MARRAGWDELLRALADLRARRAELEAAERELIADARRDGVLWRLIADALGVSTTAAHKRFRALDPTSKRRVRDPVEAELDALFAATGAGAASTEVEGPDPSTSVEGPAAGFAPARRRRRRRGRSRRRRRR